MTPKKKRVSLGSCCPFNGIELCVVCLPLAHYLGWVSSKMGHMKYKLVVCFIMASYCCIKGWLPLNKIWETLNLGIVNQKAARERSSTNLVPLFYHFRSSFPCYFILLIIKPRSFTCTHNIGILLIFY